MAKKSTYKEIKESIPTLESEKVKDFSDELDRVLAIKRIFTSEDGQELIKEMRDDCVLIIRKLFIAYKKDPKLEILMGMIASLESKYELLIKVQDISMEKELREQLDQAVIESRG